MEKSITTIPKALFSRAFWRVLGEYVGLRGRAGAGSGEQYLDNPASLGAFLDSRASHIAQTSLYGYMKTRAGTRFPGLFENPAILASINIAKWQIWLACLSDLAVYSGVLIRARSGEPAAQIRAMLLEIVAGVIEETAVPEEAGEGFLAGAQKVRERILSSDLDALQDDDSAFTESPQALVYWAPVADELKKRDVEIIRNSIRFRWQEVRRSVRRQLRAGALVKAAHCYTHPD